VDNKPNEITFHDFYNCIDAYVFPPNKERWDACPNCGLKPKIWIYDNGRHTACGCWANRYEHFSIRAESIMSVYTRNGGETTEYNENELFNNWNHWCKTKEIKYNPSDKENDMKW